MDAFFSLSAAVIRPWTGVYLRVLALVLGYGALAHVSNMLGWTGEPWWQTPWHWRVMDVVLLAFNAIAAWGLWLKSPWAVVWTVMGIILLQFVPYTLFRAAFVRTPEDIQTLNGLLGTEGLLLVVLFLLIGLKK
ncbi:MAG: hypothetical protein AAFY57_04990 [Cyanobacteria bacterium J06642_2]